MYDYLAKNKNTILPWALALIVLALLAAFPNYASNYWVIRMGPVLLFVILTVSWVLFSGPTGYMSLAPAAFFGVGIYIAAFLHADVPFAVFILAGGLAAFVVALIVGAITLRLRGIYFTIFTFGLVELIKNVVLAYELEVNGIRGRFIILPEIDNLDIFYAFLVIFAVLLLATYFIRRSKYGLAMQSIGEYEEAASHMGINTTMVKIVTFAISAFFMGAAGAVWATKLTYIDPGISFNYFYSFMPVLMALFGGMRQLYGPILGSVVFTFLKEYLVTKIADLYMVVFGIVMLIAILYLPDGLFGLVQQLWRWGAKQISGERRANT